MLVAQMQWLVISLLLPVLLTQTVKSTANTPSDISFFLGDDQTEQLTDTGDIHCAQNGVQALVVLIQCCVAALATSVTRRQMLLHTHVDGIRNCNHALQGFFNRSKQLSDLENGDWQESDMDRQLCRAGLWYGSPLFVHENLTYIP